MWSTMPSARSTDRRFPPSVRRRARVRHSENARAGRVEVGAAALPARLSIQKRLDILELVAKDARDKHRANHSGMGPCKAHGRKRHCRCRHLYQCCFHNFGDTRCPFEVRQRYSDVNLHS
jgi:hypothetical protein